MGSTPIPYSGEPDMRFENVDVGTVTDNTVSGSSESLPDFGLPSRSVGFPTSGNTLIVDGAESSSTLVAPTSIPFEFEQTVSPDGDSREFVFYCAALSLYGGQGEPLVDVDIGEDETGLSFGPTCTHWRTLVVRPAAGSAGLQGQRSSKCHRLLRSRRPNCGRWVPYRERDLGGGCRRRRCW